jgi:hypothetical protein
LGSRTSRSSFSDEEAAMLERLRLPVYGADDDAALRDILFTWWEQRFLGAAESGCRRSAMGSRDVARRSDVLSDSGGRKAMAGTTISVDSE